jgi:hypothetical protein
MIVTRMLYLLTSWRSASEKPLDYFSCSMVIAMLRCMLPGFCNLLMYYL